MCGIVGYYGLKSPKDVIIDGLKQLEYRGYDSAGVAILDHGHFKRVRAPGKLINLEKKLEHETFDGALGIGHTRWATHGGPTESNAHPHTVDGVSIVHNGIIENYQEIKAELRTQGAKIVSETDTELVAHLLSRAVKKNGGDLLKAAKEVIPGLTGAFSILAVSEQNPTQMVAFKNGPPLVVGVGKNEVVVASDVQAIIAHTNRIAYLEDEEIAFVDGINCQFFSLSGEVLKKELVTVEWNQEKAEKAGYPHFMLKEIFEQPRAVAAAIEPHIRLQDLHIDLAGVEFGASKKSAAEVFQNVERIFIVACGTSYYAGMVGEYLLESMAGISVEVDIASEFRYREPVLPPNSLVMVISQSGETADTLAALRLAKKQGALTFCICNVPHSSIDRESDARLYMRSGVEVGVASTKAFVSTLSLLNVLAIYVGCLKKKITSENEKKAVRSLLDTPSHMEHVLAYDKFFKNAAQTLKNAKGFLYMGRGVSYPIALEGALKLKELAYMHAEGYAAGEMKHGPIALIDPRMIAVVVAPKDHVYEKTVSNLEEVRARGAQIISISTGNNEKLESLSQHYLSLPEGEWNLNPLLSVIPLQLLSYHVAEALGYDVDQPRNLAKSVTVE
ncbi:MAG: glutamine--fructose-6-phosphate transaminase (isomerizing) [Bdellovibrionales bacterium]